MSRIVNVARCNGLGGSFVDSDQELSDLEVAAVLSRGSELPRSPKSPCRVQLTPGKCNPSPFRASTVLSNIDRGNVTALTPSLQGEISIHQLAAQGELLLLQEELNEGGINKQDCRGFTPLFWASACGQEMTVTYLIQNEADVHHTAPGGENSLMFASSYGSARIVEELLAKGIDINSSDENGNTALMYAAHGNHSRCVATLLRHGADLTAENHDGYTAAEIAVHRGHTAVQQAIELYILSALNDNGG